MQTIKKGPVVTVLLIGLSLELFLWENSTGVQVFFLLTVVLLYL